jgi:hypothetical protein
MPDISGKLIKCEKCEHFTWPDVPCWDCGTIMGGSSILETRETRARIFALIATAAILALLAYEALIGF